MNCQDVDRLVFQYADDELTSELKVHLATHLGTCPDCGRRARYVERFLDLLHHGAPRAAAPQRLRARVLAVLPHRDAPTA